MTRWDACLSGFSCVHRSAALLKSSTVERCIERIALHSDSPCKLHRKRRIEKFTHAFERSSSVRRVDPLIGSFKEDKTHVILLAITDKSHLHRLTSDIAMKMPTYSFYSQPSESMAGEERAYMAS